MTKATEVYTNSTNGHKSVLNGARWRAQHLL